MAMEHKDHAGILQKERWFEHFFRFGLVSKGVVYCLVGLLALATTLQWQSKEPSKTSAIVVISDQPLGTVLLALITLGLFGFVTLRFFQAFHDIDNNGNDARGMFTRAGYALSGLIYLALALFAGNLLLGGDDAADESREIFIRKIFRRDWGPVVLTLVALGIAGNGLYQIYRGVTGRFMKKIRVIGADVERLVRRAGMIGYICRGVVLVIAGYLVYHATETFDARETEGTEVVFRFIQHTFGKLLMAVIAAGLTAYGVFMFVKAKYQRIQVRFDQ